MGAGADQREQSAHAQMCSVQFGTAAAESLGLLQAAKRGGGGTGLVFRVFDGFDSGRDDSRPDNGPVVGLVVGRFRLAGDIVGSKPLHPIHQRMSEKVAFFNGLLTQKLTHAGPKTVAREAELRRPSGVVCSDLFDNPLHIFTESQTNQTLSHSDTRRDQNLGSAVEAPR